MESLKNWRNQLIFVGLLVAALFLPLIVGTPYQMHLVNMVGIYMLLSFGLNLAMGYCGQFNLALAAFWGVGAYVSTLLSVDWGVNFWVALPISGLVAAFLAGLVGLPSLKVRSHYLAIVTIGLGEIINLVLVNEREITRGAIGISHVPAPRIFGFELADSYSYFYLILAMVVLGYLWARHIVKGRLGRNFVAIRDDYVAARAMGINIAYYQILAFAISGFYAGVTGSLYAHMVNYVSPDTFAFHSMMFVLTMTLVGGMGNLLGSVAGSLMVIAHEYLREFQDFQLVLYGLMVVLIVLFFPGGVVGLASRIRSWRRSMAHPTPTEEAGEGLQFKQEVGDVPGA